MKKISAVLLVLVLVGSVAFAGFTGNAEANFGMDLDTQEYGFANVVELTSDVVFFETLVDNAGDGDIYAEIKAELTLAFDFEDEGNEYDPTAGTLDPPTDVSLNGITGNAEITSAKIGGENWYVSILGAMAAPNFASSAIDIDNTADEDPLDLDPADFVAEGAGVEVMYADYKFGIAATRGPLNDLDGNTHDIFGSVATPDFALADGLTLAFGAAGRLSNGAGGNAASGSVTGTYEMDEITASVAADVIYDGGLEAEVAVNTVIDIVTLDVYFATLDDAGTPAYTATTNILSAKAAFAIDEFTIEVVGKDLINSQALSASVKYQATEELAVTGRGGYTLNGGAWEAGADLEYAVEDYTATFGGTFKTGEILEMYAGVESTTIIPGATLALTWADADDLLDKDLAVANLGSVIASVNIAF